ncbi:nuclear transport factor 2 family protein [Paracoccus sp. 11-3]|uniref:Nuclear transport factor 2 family protein n=2 Tax=Paracoccus amoyensis TaxID=2760093 RepID=A0A926GDY5_9RHOB|nr:nuclear transport factor 2 family protein [Paracoccus amoyensis]
MIVSGQLVREFWHAMNGNDWTAVAIRFLSEDFTSHWPQTEEVIEGPAQFAQVNGAFPGQGGWRFQVISLVAQEDQIVTDTRIVQDALAIVARAITFHHVRNGLIHHQTEFWPDPYPVPEWRRGMLKTDTKQAFF